MGRKHNSQIRILTVHMRAKSLQFYPTLCDPMDCSLPSSSVHGISQATILEWVAVSFLLGLNSHLLHWAGAFLPLNHQGHLWGIHYSACQIL